MAKICVRCIVAGRVQGVFYRANARHQAERVGITGWARNLMNGTVEVLACGERDAVESFRFWLSQGPRGAHVVDVTCEPAPLRDLTDFSTR
jgi:acylphosphatase